MDENSILTSVFERNAFYRRQYLLVLSVFMLSVVVNGILIWMLYYVYRNPTQPIYFAADNIGKLIDVIPVNQPNMSTEEVTRWVTDAVQDIYSYDYVNYRSQLQSDQKYFTAYGWEKYMSALQASNNLVALKQRSMITIGKVVDVPKITTQGILSGAYAWKFQIPVLVTYWLPPFDDKSRFANAYQVTAIVQRQSILQSYKGLGILQLIGGAPTNVTPPQANISASPTG
ncbi:MAG: hypothetical protein ACD_46C00488G0005 [uncultured bacterium]|nr:MAG: hypothetical protein ACD_46C00488G0005 [uncultured bacterium]